MNEGNPMWKLCLSLRRASRLFHPGQRPDSLQEAMQHAAVTLSMNRDMILMVFIFYILVI